MSNHESSESRTEHLTFILTVALLADLMCAWAGFMLMLQRTTLIVTGSDFASDIQPPLSVADLC